jgi:hypothetical protein
VVKNLKFFKIEDPIDISLHHSNSTIRISFFLKVEQSLMSDSTQYRSLSDRHVGSNTKDVIFSLTIEALDDLLGGNDVTQQRLESLNFSSKKFNLVSLDGIEFIGVADVSLRHDIHT